MSDFGSKYKFATYNDLLKREGIRFYNSTCMYLNKMDLQKDLCALLWTQLRQCTIWHACPIAGVNLLLPMPPYLQSYTSHIPLMVYTIHMKCFIVSSLKLTTCIYLIVLHMSSFCLMFGLINLPISQTYGIFWCGTGE